MDFGFLYSFDLLFIHVVNEFLICLLVILVFCTVLILFLSFRRYKFERILREKTRGTRNV